MAPRLSCTLITACALLLLSLLLSCDEVNGGASTLASKFRNLGSKFKLVKKKEQIVDTAGDAAGNIRPPGVVAAVSNNADCKNPFFPCNPSSLAKIQDVGSKLKTMKKNEQIVDTAGDAAGNIRPPGVGAAVSNNADCKNPFFPCNPSSLAKIQDVVGDASQAGSLAAVESQKLSRKAKIASMLSRNVAEDGTKRFSGAQKKAIGGAAALGVGTAAAAVVISRRGNGKDNEKDGGQPEVKGPSTGIAENAPAGPQAKRRIVSEAADDD